MRAIDGGTFLMGSDEFYAEEGPVHEASVSPFLIDEAPVTTRQFASFVAETGYLTTAERELPAADFPELGAGERRPGSLAFRPTDGPVSLLDWRQWWTWITGANWRRPFGETGPDAADDHPVVQVSFDDATAYAAWAGARLPTEAEWEFAARGGHDGWRFAWGDEPRPGGRLMANTWQGAFPYQNAGADGWRGTSPVGSFAPNGFGLVDMIGNVWEWTTSPYAQRHTTGETSCCAVGGSGDERRVLKGGSHLCAPEYCLRYRPAARSPQSDDTSTTHIGFRCVRDA